jgi:hypothetical protein
MDNKLQYTKTIQASTPKSSSLSGFKNIFTNFDDIKISKNAVIISLLVVISLLLLGINIFYWLGDAASNLARFLSHIFGRFLAFFGYTSGKLLNKTADVVNDGVKLSSDIVDGTVHSVGDILVHASEDNVSKEVKGDLDRVLNERHHKHRDNEKHHKKHNDKKHHEHFEPISDATDSSIQQSISTKKTKWCLVGEYSGKRGCVEINEEDKCMSGSRFPTQEACMK